ncbi:MAG: PLP-dependent transferase [Ignavibacteriaceae bacterium]|nr:PLP-dependent transferase [Ignavibacteriaceae bacterium]
MKIRMEAQLNNAVKVAAYLNDRPNVEKSLLPRISKRR